MEDNKTLRNIGQQDLLTDRVYRELQEAIFSHGMPPGSSLSVPELARQLGVSRSPVREAVQHLVHEGLAVTEAHRGAVVARIGVEDLLQMYEVRELLEGLAARRATERLGGSDKDELEEIVKEHQEALDQRKGLVAHMEQDMRFHRRIRELADNQHLMGMLENLQGKVRLAMHSLWRSDDAPRLALEDHKKILRAISSGGPLEAEAAARSHIARVRAALTEEMENTGEKGYG